MKRENAKQFVTVTVTCSFCLSLAARMFILFCKIDKILLRKLFLIVFLIFYTKRLQCAQYC
jgi:hypothetical protein